jgi:hypothetical protein
MQPRFDDAGKISRLRDRRGDGPITPARPPLHLNADGCYEEPGLLVELYPDEVEERLAQITGASRWSFKPFTGHVDQASFCLVQYGRWPISEVRGRIRPHRHGSVLAFRLTPQSPWANVRPSWFLLLCPLLALLAAGYDCVSAYQYGGGLSIPLLVFKMAAAAMVGLLLAGGFWLDRYVCGVWAVSALRRLYARFEDVRIDVAQPVPTVFPADRR